MMLINKSGWGQCAKVKTTYTSYLLTESMKPGSSHCIVTLFCKMKQTLRNIIVLSGVNIETQGSGERKGKILSIAA